MQQVHIRAANHLLQTLNFKNYCLKIFILSLFQVFFYCLSGKLIVKKLNKKNSKGSKLRIIYGAMVHDTLLCLVFCLLFPAINWPDASCFSAQLGPGRIASCCWGCGGSRTWRQGIYKLRQRGPPSLSAFGTHELCQRFKDAFFFPSFFILHSKFSGVLAKLWRAVIHPGYQNHCAGANNEKWVNKKRERSSSILSEGFVAQSAVGVNGVAMRFQALNSCEKHGRIYTVMYVIGCPLRSCSKRHIDN